MKDIIISRIVIEQGRTFQELLQKVTRDVEEQTKGSSASFKVDKLEHAQIINLVDSYEQVKSFLFKSIIYIIDNLTEEDRVCCEQTNISFSLPSPKLIQDGTPVLAPSFPPELEQDGTLSSAPPPPPPPPPAPPPPPLILSLGQDVEDLPFRLI